MDLPDTIPNLRALVEPEWVPTGLGTFEADLGQVFLILIARGGLSYRWAMHRPDRTAEERSPGFLITSGYFQADNDMAAKMGAMNCAIHWIHQVATALEVLVNSVHSEHILETMSGRPVGET